MNRWRKTIIVLLVLLVGGAAFWAAIRVFRPSHDRVGYKDFTESVILGELGAALIRQNGEPASTRNLGGTRVVYEALKSGQIDAYVDYTGTLIQEVFAGRELRTDAQLRSALAEQGIGMTEPLGFNNTYAIGMRRTRAEQLGIAKISDLRQHPELAFGFSNEFVERKDGWPAVQSTYDLPQRRVKGLQHDLAYRAMESGDIDATDLYSTDAEIAYYDLKVLEDDRHLFPEYKAVFLYRLDLQQRAPAVIDALKQLEGRIDAAAMIALNKQAKIQKRPESEVAQAFAAEHFSADASGGRGAGLGSQLWRLTLEHLQLVAISLTAAVLTAIPLGVTAAKRPWAGKFILAIVAGIYTIPSLALLVFMIPLLGIGGAPAVVALFLYSLLPIVRNTYAGLRAIPLSLRESAEVLGLPPLARLRRIELPMALPQIMAGIQTSVVINIGTATLGALIGAGGYGQPILTGIRLDNKELILLGAIPAALLALLAQALFELLERLVVPRGLQLQKP